ncbi:MAG: hypothetical protein DWC07_03045 [Candidatus Poseidoniales archaeon]|nr:MAG: hypothetical protein DWC07_03045 [Candidatus Poseidoniales archaeon]
MTGSIVLRTTVADFNPTLHRRVLPLGTDEDSPCFERRHESIQSNRIVLQSHSNSARMVVVVRRSTACEDGDSTVLALYLIINVHSDGHGMLNHAR